MPPHPVRILVVEDNATLRADVLDALRGAGFDAQVSTTLAMAREAAESPCDLILLDLILPDGEGIELCRELRAAGRSIPIIMMTGMDRPEQRVAGLDAGADDYVVKPFHIPELIARVRSILRRTGKSGMGSFVKHLDLWIDADQVAAGRGTVTFKLKPREFDLLSFLVRHPGRAWTRQELLDQVWGHTFEGDARTVDLHVRRLRAKIEPNEDSPHYLETVWGVGYRMATELPVNPKVGNPKVGNPKDEDPKDMDELQPMPPPGTPTRREVSGGPPRSQEQEQGQ